MEDTVFDIDAIKAEMAEMQVIIHDLEAQVSSLGRTIKRLKKYLLYVTSVGANHLGVTKNDILDLIKKEIKDGE